MTRLCAANGPPNNVLVPLHFSLPPTRVTKAIQGQKLLYKTHKQSNKQMENQIYAKAHTPVQRGRSQP